MRSIGYVSKVEKDIAEVVLGEHQQCRRCGACLAASAGRQRSIKAANLAGARVGDRVEIEIEPKRAIGTAFLVFIVPLAAALGGGMIGYRVGLGLGVPAVAVAIGLGGLCFGLSLVLLKSVEAIAVSRPPEIVRIVPDDHQEGGC